AADAADDAADDVANIL
ncbi:hypothetical protein TNIN_48391, partial [Trichonephila inaurata madagascariensis]